MKKTLISGLIAGTILLSSAGLAGCGKKAEYTSYEGGAQTVLMEQAAIAAESGTPASEQTTTGRVQTDTSLDYLSPLVTLRADPYLYKSPTTGKYYFTGSYPEYDRIDLRCADTVNGIASAQPKVIWERENGDIAHVWAPELHYVMGQWVIYYAASETPGNAWDIKCRALVCDSDDPMTGNWTKAGAIRHAPGDSVSFQTGMSLDMTVFENKGKWYAIWAQKPNTSNLYLAEMESALKLKTAPIIITQPEYAWERVGENVNEGPAVLKNAGKIFVSYSASATDENYCMGLLEINEDANLLDVNNWKKRSEPVFKSIPESGGKKGVYGPGHNSFVKGDNDEWLCILHFRDYKGFNTNNSLYDHNRHAHVMKIEFDEDGAPIFNLNIDDLYNTPFENDKAK